MSQLEPFQNRERVHLPGNLGDDLEHQDNYQGMPQIRSPKSTIPGLHDMNKLLSALRLRTPDESKKPPAIAYM
jgi:hypothetical protein